MNLKLTIPAAMAALMIASTSASAAELITNGDFANGTYAGWTLTGTAADGGTTKVISLDGGAFGEVVPNDPNVPNSNYGLYFYSDIPLGVGASQTFNVATAGTYKVSFDYYIPNNGIFNPEDADLSASVNSTNFANFDADVLGNDNRTWRTASTTETLQAGSNTFSFGLSVPANVANGVQTGKAYAADFVVSNVSVAGVPEPATWVMMLAGFGGLGAVLRMGRRQRLASIAA
jgi:hypothetical protein